MEKELKHIPVLVEEVVRLLDLAPGEIVVDATVGDGGHAGEMLKKISPGGYLIGIDRDPAAVKVAYENLSGQKFKNQFCIIHGDFVNLDRIVQDAGYRGVDAILFDLGLSSRELLSGRGFSFQENVPLDMRFDPSEERPTAADIINSWPKEKLADIIWQFGEEQASRKIAAAIVAARRKEKIITTTELAEIVTQAKGGRRGRIHPATQTFQALRIAVNHELEHLKTALPQAIQLLNPGGRLAVISYHSLEDRIAKQLFKGQAQAKIIVLATKKPLRPSYSEVKKNPRARSAKLRVIQKLI